MAERRMFSKKIIDSDVFLDMPLSTQALYFHLSLRADIFGTVLICEDCIEMYRPKKDKQAEDEK